VCNIVILDEVCVSRFRYCSVNIIDMAYFLDTFRIVEKGMDLVYLAHTVALAVWWVKADVAIDATKYILYVFEHACVVEVVAGNQYEVGDQFDECKLGRMRFLKRGRHCKQDLHQVLVLGTGLLFHTGKIASKLVNFGEARNYGELIIYQVQILFLAINIFQKTSNSFPGISFNRPFSSWCNQSTFKQLYLSQRAGELPKFGQSGYIHSPTSIWKN